MKLPKTCKTRAYARELLERQAKKEVVTLHCDEVKVMGQGFCREVISLLLVEGKVKELHVVKPPAHAVLYLRKEAHDAKRGKKLVIIPRG